jgi:Mat/Ecp fimbriae major subunit
MTTRFMKAAIAATALAGAFAGTTAQAATATATAKAKILAPITVTKTADLDFATIVTGTAPATVGVSTAGVRSCGVGLVCSGTATAAKFDVTGTTNAVVTVSVPSSVTLTSGSDTMSVTGITSSATGGVLTLTGVAATDVVSVGGTLNVAGGQANGVYTNTADLTVTVNYQ